MDQFRGRIAVQPRQDFDGGNEFNAAFGEPAARGGGEHGIVGGNGVLGDENMEGAFEAFGGQGADAGVKMNAGDYDRVAVNFFQRGIQRAAGNAIETGFV